MTNRNYIRTSSLCIAGASPPVADSRTRTRRNPFRSLVTHPRRNPFRPLLTKNPARAWPFCAVATLFAWTSPAPAQERNCPLVANQVIQICCGQPVTFHLAVTNPELSIISIFQYPLGGILQQTGPTQLDYSFVPGRDFPGTTSFTYRVTPPAGCLNGVKLGHVDLVGGPATTTAAGLPVNPDTGIAPASPPQGIACGFGVFPALLFTGLSLLAARTIARH